MELDPQHLKEKALLLLQRERELFELRIKHERLTAWLKLAQGLPPLFVERAFALDEVCGRLRKALLEGLKVQRVLFLTVEEDGLRPLAPAGAVRPLTPELRRAIRSEAVGVVNDHNQDCFLAPKGRKASSAATARKKRAA